MEKELVLFLDRDEPIAAYVEQTTPHTIRIRTDTEPDTAGFYLVTEDGGVYGKYPDYTTVYQEIDGGFVLSDDGSVYTEPEPYVPYVVPDGRAPGGDTGDAGSQGEPLKQE